jgi:hypothetical protein
MMRNHYGRKTRTRNDRLGELKLRMFQFPHAYKTKTAEEVAQQSGVPLATVQPLLEAVRRGLL